MILEIHHQGEVIMTLDLNQVERLKDLEFSVRLSSKVDEVEVTDQELQDVVVPRRIVPGVYDRWKGRQPIKFKSVMY